MNVILWILQVLLAVLYIAGGAYKTFAFGELAAQFNALPHEAWRALGVFEVIGEVLLVLPAALKLKPSLTPIAAAVLTLETFAIAVVYASYSLSLEAENPLVWSVVMGLMVACVAVGRYRRNPSRTSATTKSRTA